MKWIFLVNKADKIALLTEWECRLRELHLHFDKLTDTMGPIDGPFSEAMWRMSTAYTKAVSVAVGDAEAWCAWYEEMMILSGYEIGIVTMPDGTEFNVECVSDLVEVIG